jgi:peptide chain release factor 1
MEEKLRQIEAEYGAIEEKLSRGRLAPTDFKELSRRHSVLAPLMGWVREWRQIKRQMDELKSLLSETDPEMRQMAEDELAQKAFRANDLEGLIRRDLLPKDPDDAKSVYLELRAAAGGDESALFAAELLRLYTRFADTRGWKAELVELNATGLKGVKSAILFIQGEGAFSWLRYEGGVHRVQRVPVTEASGRIHTSTVTVAVMPEVSEVEIEVNMEDLKIDTYRAGGHGGQNVNKVETAIRITHIPSGIIVQCQDERSQLKNKLRALSVLRAKLSDAQRQEAVSQHAQMRRTQVGSGERSEKIRTYNFPQNRLTDHRLERSWYNLPAIMEGEIGPVFEALREARIKQLEEAA